MFSSTNQPLKRRGKGKIKTALALFQQAGISPLVKALDAIRRVKDPKDQAVLWLKMAEFIHPKALDDIPKSPDESVKAASKLFEEIKRTHVEKSTTSSDSARGMGPQGPNPPLQTPASTSGGSMAEEQRETILPAHGEANGQEPLGPSSSDPGMSQAPK